MSLMIAGTMAFDAIETPFGKTDKIIGGSATYQLGVLLILHSQLNKFLLLEEISLKENWMR